MIISIDAEESLDKIQHRLVTKTLYQLAIKGKFLSLTKGICKNLQLTSSHSHSPTLV